MTKRSNGEGSIYKTGGRYRAYVWVETPEGRRVRKFVSGSTKEAARRAWVTLKKKADAGPVSGKSPRLEDFLSTWLTEVVRPSLARHTFATYEGAVRLYIVPGLGKHRLDALTVSDVRRWVNKLRATCLCCAQGKDAARAQSRCCALRKCCKQFPSDSTVHQAWRVLRAALSSAQRDELVTRNVAALVRMPVPRSKTSEVWSVDQARTFLASAKSADDPYYVGYLLLLALGLRRGEVLGLAWEDVDLDRREARICWQLQRVAGSFSRSPVKTRSSEAVLPLPTACVDALRAQREFQQREAKRLGDAWQNCGLVMTSTLGTPVDPRNFHRKFKERAKQAGVPVIPVHSTRRTCATLLVHLGVHPRVAMQILRHSQIAVTMNVYAQVSSSSSREAVDLLDESLRGF